jgi:bacillithiol biosynthesis deacetylase BshB1
MNIDILAFAAHPDDIELSCSGTIMKHIDQGFTVGIVDLTEGELGTRGTPELRYHEAKVAAELMGISYRHNLSLEDGFFRDEKSAIHKIIEQIRLLKPRIVLTNAISDRHPDHGRASKLVTEACFYSGLPKIKTFFQEKIQLAHRPTNVLHYIQDRYIHPNILIDITGYQNRKMECIKAFKSQFYDPNSKEPETPISSASFLENRIARDREFGRNIGVEFAEGFVFSRMNGLNNFFELI